MWLWNFSHDVIGVHAYLLPSLAVGLGMAITGIVHTKKQKERDEEFNKVLRGETPEVTKEA